MSYALKRRSFRLYLKDMHAGRSRDGEECLLIYCKHNATSAVRSSTAQMPLLCVKEVLALLQLGLANSRRLCGCFACLLTCAPAAAHATGLSVSALTEASHLDRYVLLIAGNQNKRQQQ